MVRSDCHGSAGTVQTPSTLLVPRGRGMAGGLYGNSAPNVYMKKMYFFENPFMKLSQSPALYHWNVSA